MLFISSLLFLATIFPIFSIFQIRKINSTLLALYLSWYALIVLTCEISGFLGLLGSEWFFLTIQILEGLIIWGIWFLKGKPDLIMGWNKRLISRWINSIVLFIKKNPFTSSFSAIVIGGYGFLAWLILRVPPNNTDSMKTHLARVVYWLQQNSFEQLTIRSIAAKIYPFDAQLNVLWTILFSHSDKFVGFVQYFSAIFCTIAIYAIARLMKGSRRSSLIISLIWLTYPVVVYQATSTQVDLVIAALFTISIYFLFDHLQASKQSSLFFSALALGLALGTKSTIFIMAPGILIMLILFLTSNHKAISWVIRWSILTTLFFLALGSFIYFNNIRYYNNPLGPSSVIANNLSTGESLSETIRYNAPRLIFQFISFDALPIKLANQATEIKGDIFENAGKYSGLNLDSTTALSDPNVPFSYDLSPSYNEDASWFGFSSVMVIIPAIIFGIYFGLKRKDKYSIVLFILGITYSLFEMIFRPGWDPYQGRYFIISMAISTPLAVSFTNEKIISKIFIFIVTVIALVTFFFSVFSNTSKPLLGRNNLESRYIKSVKEYFPGNPIHNYYQKATIKIYDFLRQNLPTDFSISDYDDVQLRTLSNRSQHETIVRVVNDLVPQDARMGFMSGVGDFDYVFFGENLTRVLININSDNELFDKEWMRSKNMSFVLISEYERFSDLPDYLNLTKAVDGWGLYSIDFQ